MTLPWNIRLLPWVSACLLVLLASPVLNAEESVREQLEAFLPDSIAAGDEVDDLQMSIGDLAREHMDEVTSFCETFATCSDDDDRLIDHQDSEFVRQYLIVSGVARIVSDEQVPMSSSAHAMIRKVAIVSPYPIIRACALLILEEEPEEEDLRLLVARLGDTKLGGGHGSPAEVAAGALELLTESRPDVPYEASDRLKKVARFWEGWWHENEGYVHRVVEEEFGSRSIKVVVDVQAKSRQRKIDFLTGCPAAD